MANRPQNKRKQKTADAVFAPLLAIAIGVGLIFTAKPVLSHMSKSAAEQAESSENSADPAVTAVTTTTETTTVTTTTTTRFPAAAGTTTETVTVDDTSLLIARNAALIRVSDTGNTLIAGRNPDEAIYPASLTKLMTLITYLDLKGEPAPDETITMSGDVIAAQRARLAYVAGFQPGEQCKITDLLYAMMLPSGADAAVMLAVHAAGSEEQFVSEMNRLASDMGLQQSVFYNCTGLNDERHFSSVQDIARVLQYACSSPLAKQILSTKKYTTAATPEHPEGIELVSTTLSRMVGNELEGLPVPLHVMGGKTGFTNPAGQCLATWAEDASGQMYICVVAGSTTLEPLDAIGDTLTLYQLTSLPLAQIQRITVDEADLPDYEHN